MRLLIIGSQVRALVRPPPSLRVETFVSHLAFIPPEWGFSHTYPSPWVVSAWQKAATEGLSPHQKFPFPASAETGSMTGWSPNGLCHRALANCISATAVCRSTDGQPWAARSALTLRNSRFLGASDHSGLRPRASNCWLHSAGGSRSRSTPMPRGQAALDGCFNKVRCAEGERDRHVDLPDAALLADADFLDCGHSTETRALLLGLTSALLNGTFDC